jgi:ubiquinone/menaquinone biosynthesis C-methylase UbiE
MSFYSKAILPRVTDLALSGRTMARLREQTTAGLSGEVLEVGFGSGRHVPHLPEGVTRLLAIEPVAVGAKLSAGRVEKRGIRVDYIGIDSAELPLADESVDHVLSTWTLCTIPDVESAISEILRVLRPGGTLHFLEHGRSPEPKVERWQDRLTPIQKRIFGGCHLNRPIDKLIESTDLEIISLQTFYTRGPRTMGYMYQGIANKP